MGGTTMILTRTPLRISFVGGGSDRPSFYNEEPGACVAAAIDKYVYVAVNPKYDGSIRAAYSVTENVASVDELQHELIREALKASYVLDGGIEIHSIADIPGGTGLGSSSSFTVGLLASLYTMNEIEWYGPQWLAHDACRIEIDRCAKQIGKQDQYTAAYGGVNLLGFTSKGVTVAPIACDLDALSAHCLLLDTGMARQGDAGQVLAGQQQDRDDVRELAALAGTFAYTLRRNDFEMCGKIMDTAWMIKRGFIGSDQIDAWYSLACHWGAWGGKLCGAGGGGFLLFLAPPERHQAIIQALGLRHVPIRVGVPGCEVVYGSL
jgi:D-glycero-alpha-D-manno-heptose-7-phosphate kinase